MDSDGYSLTVGSNGPVVVGPNDSVAVTDLPPGSVPLLLGGIAPNCQPQAALPIAATIVAGTTTRVSVDIRCTALPPTVGGIAVTTATTGLDLDSDGYTVTLDGGAPHAVQTQDSLLFPSVLPGQHTVAISALRSNCVPAGAPTISTTVVAGGIAIVRFSVTCTPRVGVLRIATTTTGRNQDPDGYTVTVDAGAPVTIPTNGIGLIPDLHEGSVILTHAGTTPNCRFLSADSLPLTVAYGDTTELVLQARCLGSLRNRVVFTSNCQLQATGRVVYCGIMSMAQDGTGREMITIGTDPNGSPYDYPDVAPDASSIAFARFDATHNFGLWVVDSLGNTETAIPLPMPAWEPRWSPDGSTLAFNAAGDGSNVQIWTAHADGSSLTQLSPSGLDVQSPAWAPNARHIAALGADLMVMSTTTSSITHIPVSIPNIAHLDWSPAGDVILAEGGIGISGFGDLYTITLTGSTETQLTQDGRSTHPRWSPDGTHIVFQRLSSDETNSLIWLMTSLGASSSPLSPASAHDGHPQIAGP